MLEEIKTYCMERWATNRMRFQNLTNDAVLPNIRRKVEKTSSYTNLWIVRYVTLNSPSLMDCKVNTALHKLICVNWYYRMSNEHILVVRHVENPVDMFFVNLKDNLYSCRRWELTRLPCVHALSCMKSRNFRIEYYILEDYRKSRYMSVYKPMIYLVNGTIVG